MWDTAEPGPDVELEARARARQPERVEAFGTALYYALYEAVDERRPRVAAIEQSLGDRAVFQCARVDWRGAAQRLRPGTRRPGDHRRRRRLDRWQRATWLPATFLACDWCEASTRAQRGAQPGNAALYGRIHPVPGCRRLAGTRQAAAPVASTDRERRGRGVRRLVRATTDGRQTGPCRGESRVMPRSRCSQISGVRRRHTCFDVSIVERVGGWRHDLPVIQDARFVLDCALHGGRFVYCSGEVAQLSGAQHRLGVDARSPRIHARLLAERAVGRGVVAGARRRRIEAQGRTNQGVRAGCAQQLRCGPRQLRDFIRGAGAARTGLRAAHTAVAAAAGASCRLSTRGRARQSLPKRKTPPASTRRTTDESPCNTEGDSAPGVQHPGRHHPRARRPTTGAATYPTVAHHQTAIAQLLRRRRGAARLSQHAAYG